MDAQTDTIGRTLADLVKAGLPAEERARAEAVLETVRAARLISAVAPEAWGGPGWGLSEAARLTFDVAKASGSAGLILAMHLSQYLCLVRHGADVALLAEAGARLQASQGLIASVASEADVGGDIFGTRCTLADGSDGWALRKDTPNTSYVPQAKAFLVTARQETGKKPVLKLALAWADQTDAKEIRVNNLMGMRGIDNRAWSFGFQIQPEALFPAPFQAIARETMTPASHILWAAVWSGIAASARQKAGRFVAKELAGKEPLQSDMAVSLAALRTRQYEMNALIRDAIAAWEAGPPNGPQPLTAGGRLNRLKISVSEGAVAIAQGALAICGLRGFAEGGPYSVAAEVRDALSGPLMVSNHRLLRNTILADRFGEETI